MTHDDIEDEFGYHPANEEQKSRYKRIEDKAKELAHLMLDECPKCQDTTLAIRRLRESKFLAIAAIAVDRVRRDRLAGK